jgi:ribosome-binding factor A
MVYILKQKKKPSARPLRVAEEIRKILSLFLVQGEIHIKLSIAPSFINITEVSMSPDLKLARVRYTLLGMDDVELTKDDCHLLAPKLRQELGRQMSLKYTPEVFLHFDESFERVGRIEALLDQIAHAPKSSDDGESN